MTPGELTEQHLDWIEPDKKMWDLIDEAAISPRPLQVQHKCILNGVQWKPVSFTALVTLAMWRVLDQPEEAT